jgi:hypothetical protein
MQFNQFKVRDFIALLERAAVLSLALCLTASAKDAKIGDVLLKLPPPPGYCEVDPSRPSDLLFSAVMERSLKNTGNRLIALSADCTQLKDWRAGKRKLLDNLAQYQTKIDYESLHYGADAAEFIKGVCDLLRAEGEKLLTGMEPDMRARWKEILKNVKVNETRFIGVLGEEPGTCYMAVLQRAAIDGRDKTQIAVGATTIVGGKLVYLYLWAPHVSANSIVDLFALTKAQVVRLKAAN